MTISHPYRVLTIVEDAFLGIVKYQTRDSKLVEGSALIAAAGAGSLAQVARQVFDSAGEARSSLPMGSEGLSRLLGYGAAVC